MDQAIIRPANMMKLSLQSRLSQSAKENRTWPPQVEEIRRSFNDEFGYNNLSAIVIWSLWI